MDIIKLDATDSTNAYLKIRMRQSPLADFTSVLARQQSKGRGQMGASWESEPGKNLTFSTLKKFSGLNVTDAFLLNICTSLAVARVLEHFSIPQVYVKWPNDIMSGSRKICGILIENILLGNQITTSIFGIGLNINQTVFHTVSNATSMKLLLGEHFNLDGVHRHILNELKRYLGYMEAGESVRLRKAYEHQLFRKDIPSTFQDPQGHRFMGIIRGVSGAGKLLVELEDTSLDEFDLKQVKLLY